MDERPEQPPEGKLIEEAAGDLGLSIREAARRAGISYGRWRQIVKGYQNVSPGSYARVHAPAKTLAGMARVVRVSADDLEQAGRGDAADILRSPQVPPAPQAVAVAGDLDVFLAAEPAELAPHERAVWAEVSAAKGAYGPSPAGVQVFPANEREAQQWEIAILSEAERVRLIAILRMRWARGEPGERRRPA